MILRRSIEFFWIINHVRGSRAGRGRLRLHIGEQLAPLYPRFVAHARRHTQYGRHRALAMSLRSILHVSRSDQLSAIQFLAPLLARSYFFALPFY